MRVKPPGPELLRASHRRSAGAWQLHALRFALILLALHLPSWLVSFFMGGPRAEERPLFNLDLLLAAAVACLSTVAGTLMLVVALAADFIRSAATNFHFMSALDFVDAARFLDMLNWRTFLAPEAVGGVVGLLACMWLVLSQARRDRRLWLPLMAMVFAVAGMDVANGSFRVFGLDKDTRSLTMNFAGSPLWNVWHSQKRSALVAMQPFPRPATYTALRDWQLAHPRSSSMLLLVESMGLPSDPAVLAWLGEKMETKRLRARWHVQQSDEFFSGSTTFGELRTLCGLQGHYSQLDDTLAQGCLPKMLGTQGVTSLGIHGFGLRMFDRSQWWPRVGLTPWQWAGAHLPMNCNRAFPGVCDSAVVAQALTQVQQPARFVYALTLDTHLPLDPKALPELPADLKATCDASRIPEQACHLVQRLGDLLAGVEQALAASVATPFVVVVGDHAPPFGEHANRRSFVAEKVLMFTLSPRTFDQAANAGY